MTKSKAKKLVQKRKIATLNLSCKRFGRFSDIERNFRNTKNWLAALECFSEGKYIDSIVQILQYLKNEEENNVHWEQSEEMLMVKIRQGSAEITAYAHNSVFKASASLGIATALHVGFMRKLLERNFFLQHSRFALSDDNTLLVIFDSPLQIASPYKIYHGLRELAVIADQEDDLLSDEFTEVNPLSESNAMQTGSEAMVTFLRKKIRTLMSDLEQGGKVLHRNPGTISYLALDLAYRLDYLLCPQGYTMRTIENIHRLFFQEDELSLERKVHLILKELKQIDERSDEQLKKEFYPGVYTFGLAKVVPQSILQTFIKSELPAMQWYISNNQKLAAAAVPGFIAGYLLYHYNLPGPVRYLLHLLYEQTEEDLHLIEGFYQAGESGWHPERIMEKIKYASRVDSDVYGKWTLNYHRINLENPILFAKTLLEMAAEIELKYPDQ